MVAKVSWARGASWIKAAVGMVIDRPGPWIGGWAATFGAGLVLSLIPVIGNILSQLLTFVMTLFFLCYANAQMKGEEFDFESYVAQGRIRIGRLILMSVLSLCLFLLAAAPVFGSLIAAGGYEFLTSQAKGLTISPASIAMLSVGGAISGILSVLALAATAFTTPLILFQNQSIGSAVRLSLRAAFSNLAPMIFYAILLAIFLAVCAAPLMLGLLIGFPAVTASFYLAYEEILGKRETV